MGSKGLRARLAERRANDERSALQRGERFAIAWTAGVGSYGPVYFKTLADAEAKREDMIKKNEKEIPDDYFMSQASVTTLKVSISEHVDGEWRQVAGSERSCVWEVEYADKRRGR